MPESYQVTQQDVVVASLVAQRVEHLAEEMALLAATLGVQARPTMIIGAALSHALRSGQEITRDQWAMIYEGTMAVISMIEKAGPADTANAATSEEATVMARDWGDAISDIAFSFDGIEDLGIANG